ncbi:TRAFAC clade GTPase domain-containing protein [Sphaerothrix gracilis]|uniref:TRAFAC clade GTPase domain-containing protein n=1 Tax=Sphaerothrix gracilis TaxID=3151835 RepID=UPI0031FBC9DB
MFEQFKKQVSSASNASSSQKDAVIRVIGDRASGKTTYMAALARFPHASSNNLIQSITAINDDGRELIAKAQNLLEQGLELEPTDLETKAEIIKDYRLSILTNDSFSLKRTPIGLTGSPTLQMNVSFKDYAGEFFSDLLHRSQDSQLADYLEDCSQATGIMFLLDGSAQRKDAEYAAAIEKFFNGLVDTKDTSTLKRIALVLTKCELPDLWIKRNQPEKLAHAKFKQVCAKLQSWQLSSKGNVNYFATSAFGVVGSRFAEPNSKQLSRDQGGVTSILRDPQHWRPFGLVSPIYWLCTGNRQQQLDEE